MVGTLVRYWQQVPPLLYSTSPFSSLCFGSKRFFRNRFTREPTKRFFRNLCSYSTEHYSATNNSRTPQPTSELQIFNTMTKQKELFKPKVPGKVGMYVCGVTTYDLSHIGHARVYVAFDVLYRLLLNPRFHYQEGFEFSDNIRSGVTKVIERLAPNVTFAIEATREIAQFRGKIGRFGDLTAQTAVGIMNPDEWWMNFGIDDLELQNLAIRILSQTCSSSGCERNWIVFERIHTKRINRLEHKRLNDLVYTHYNLRLKERYLRHLDYEVSYIRNFTDVDDKIIARANELREDPLSLSSRYCNEFLVDMAYLQCLPPSVEPKVSDHIHHIIDMINKIIDNGCAYIADGDVYFSIDKFPDYGCLSGRKQEDNRAGERVAVDSRKQNPADFALWKSAKPGEPYWESPWGHGRPGWHIECSAMSYTYLGHSFDIHGGGMDLVFPHHENEIAQSCAACKESNVSYWIHNGFVTVDSEKMSKSLGNFFTIRQVIELYHPLALRLFLMGTHYRSPMNYSDALLESASERAFYIYQTLHDCEELLTKTEHRSSKESIPHDIQACIDRFRYDFQVSMADDLHTNVVLSALSEPLKTINDLLHTKKGKKQESRIESILALEKEVREGLTVLGLMPSSYSEVLQELRNKALKRAGVTEDQILQKIEDRNLARMNKEYEKSDQIRTELAALGIALMDGPEGTIWRPSIPVELPEQVTS